MAQASKASAVQIQNDALVLGPVRVSFQRTLRIPDSGVHPLPPGLGRFAVRRVEDYRDSVPPEWLERGGVFLPVYQREAMWLSFDADEPAALQVGAGKVCAVSGERWRDGVTRDPQNYLALPEQPWLDGINAGQGFVRQFVAVRHGAGTTIEGQVTGREVHGGVQLRAVGLTSAALRSWREQQRRRRAVVPFDAVMGSMPSMGLGAGGRMRQEVYADDRALSDYDETQSWRVFVHLCPVALWTSITGELPPPSPVDRDAYVEAGLPWFDYYDADLNDLAPSDVLAKVKSVVQASGDAEDPFVPVHPGTTIPLKDTGGVPVAEGTW